MDVSASSEEQSCSRAALAVVSILQVLGKERNKACFPFVLPFFIPDLSSDLKKMVKKRKVVTHSLLLSALLGCAGQKPVLFCLARCSQPSAIVKLCCSSPESAQDLQTVVGEKGEGKQ